LDPYLWLWLAVTGALSLLSAAVLAMRLRAGRRGMRKRSAGDMSSAAVCLPRGPDLRLTSVHAWWPVSANRAKPRRLEDGPATDQALGGIAATSPYSSAELRISGPELRLTRRAIKRSPDFNVVHRITNYLAGDEVRASTRNSSTPCSPATCAIPK
jgi:hypothetical protein